MAEFNEAIAFVHSSNKARMHEKKKKELSEKICTTCNGNHFINTSAGHINCPTCVCNTFFSASFTNKDKSSTNL
jgi:hypothetical protein